MTDSLRKDTILFTLHYVMLFGFSV